MLTQIDLQHFKCFANLKLPLCPLTLLSGVNASGKSTVLQALVLLHQTMREHEWSSRLMLNGAAIQLGTVADVIDQVHGHRECEIFLFDDGKSWYRWEFTGERDEMSMEVKHVRISEIFEGDIEEFGPFESPRYLLPSKLLSETIHYYLLTERLRDLTYLSAERLGPREYYSLDDPQLTPIVGPRGEYAASVLHSGRDTRVLDGLVIQNTPPIQFPAGRGLDGSVLSGLQTRNCASSTRQCRDVGDSYIQRNGFSKAVPYRFRTYPGSSYCSCGLVRKTQWIPPDRKSRSASASSWPGGDGRIFGQGRFRWRTGHP